MKIKCDFITNSSSCSFTIAKRYLNEMQIMAIKDHIEFAHLLSQKNPDWDFGWADEWKVTEFDDRLDLDTSMDNFDMSFFLKCIGVPDEAIEDYDHSNGW